MYARLRTLLLLVALCSALSPTVLQHEASAWSWVRKQGNLRERLNLVPLPANMTWSAVSPRLIAVRGDALDLTRLRAVFGSLGPRQSRAIARFETRFARLARAGTRNVNYMPFPWLYEWAESSPAGVIVDVSAFPPEGVISYPQLGDDESYTLTTTLSASGALLCNVSAPTTTGVLRAFSTLLQLIALRPPHANPYRGRFYLPVDLRIEDRPHMRWRGGMLDVARRFHDVEDLKRILDGFEYYKLNVLHLHLSDDQGWRLPVAGWPKLGSEPFGPAYTRQAMQELVEYAADRGIRVYPEFKFPARCAALLYIYPELAPDNHPSSLPDKWGGAGYTVDPTLEVTYRFITDLAKVRTLMLFHHQLLCWVTL
jgi:hypothetical protein